MSFPSNGFSGTVSTGHAQCAPPALQILTGLILCYFHIPLEDYVGLKTLFDQKTTENLSAKLAENQCRAFCILGRQYRDRPNNVTLHP